MRASIGRCLLAMTAAAATLAAASSAAAQAGAAQAGPAKAAAKPAAKSKYRILAPGVETTIPIEWDAADTVAIHDLVDVLKIPDLEWTPTHAPKTETLAERAKAVPVRRTIWNLEFTFKPVRFIRLDLPTAKGGSERKLVWYIVYRVKNNGQHLVPRERTEEEKAELPGEKPGEKAELALLPKSVATDRKEAISLAFDPKAEAKPQLRFYPKLVLECPRIKPPKAYTDHILPKAIAAIQEREDANRKLLDSVTIGRRPVGISTAKEDNSVWGVATWEDVDPTADVFSIYIHGLTNAYRWKDDPDKAQPDKPGAGRTYVEKVLKLNFVRPSDEFHQKEEEIRYGRADGVDYEWVWR